MGYKENRQNRRIPTMLDSWMTLGPEMITVPLVPLLLVPDILVVLLSSSKIV